MTWENDSLAGATQARCGRSRRAASAARGAAWSSLGGGGIKAAASRRLMTSLNQPARESGQVCTGSRSPSPRPQGQKPLKRNGATRRGDFAPAHPAGTGASRAGQRRPGPERAHQGAVPEGGFRGSVWESSACRLLPGRRCSMAGDTVNMTQGFLRRLLAEKPAWRSYLWLPLVHKETMTNGQLCPPTFTQQMLETCLDPVFCNSLHYLVLLEHSTKAPQQ